MTYTIQRTTANDGFVDICAGTYCDEIILLSWNFPTVNCKKKVIGFPPRGLHSNFNVSAIRGSHSNTQNSK